MDADGISDLSSELSSIASMSPPPMTYPSPESSQDYDTISTTCISMSQVPFHQNDGPPPAKKRKIAEPKPRTTVHLDLDTKSNSTSGQKAQYDLLFKVLQKRRKIVVIAGAGISVSAGIPDFRSSNGLFTTLRSEHKLKASGKHLFDASVYQTDSSTSTFHDMVRSMSHLVSAAEPTAFHHMLATIASQGRLMRLYTQNVDGIDTSLPPLVTSVPLSSKGPWPRTIQLHGGLERMVCSKCNHLSDFQPALFDGPDPPPCDVCLETDKVRTDHAGKRSHGVGKLRPRIVLYNEHNPDEEAIGAVVSSDLRNRPDAVIVVGTSMKIPGVKRMVREMCGVVRGRKNGLSVWINQDPPPVGKEFEDCWDLVVKGKCDEVARHAAMGQWNEEEVEKCSESEVERAKQRSGDIQIVIETPTKQQKFIGIPTPLASPLSKATKMNPASNGRSISQILKSSSNPQPKPKTTKKCAKKPSKPTIHPKINFKVTKPTAKTKKMNPKAWSPGDAEPSTAMAPISPQAARNNGPVSPATPRKCALASPTGKLLFPNLDKCSGNSLTESMDLVRKRSRDTISPETIPRNMAPLLD